MIKLDPNKIDLWLIYPDQISDGMHLQAYRQMLSFEEQCRAQQLATENATYRYVITRALVRIILSRYAAIEPQQWIFKRNAYGKPEIANESIRTLGLSFNLSHTEGLMVLSVACDRTVGVDAELLRVYPAALATAQAFFSHEEVCDLMQLESALQQERFMQIWTLKEAYIKARGMGLSIPLNQFGFRFLAQNKIHLSVHATLDDAALAWKFWQFRLPENHLIALCAQRYINSMNNMNATPQLTVLTVRKFTALFTFSIEKTIDEQVIDLVPIFESI